jgi:hypothetical protein
LQLGSIFLVLLGCRKVAEACFENEGARWSGVTLVTVLLTMPIAGTALFLVDTYLHPRALAAGAILLALAACLKKNWITTSAWLIVAALMHPLMALFGVSLMVFAGVEPWGEWRGAKATGLFLLLPLGLFSHPSEAWKEATLTRRYYFPLMWTWYEWLGLIAPILLVWWFSRIARRKGMATFERLATRLVAFAIFQFAVGAVMTFPAATEQLSSFQPMRWLHIFYFLFLVMAGGLIGQFLLCGKPWRWLILFLPLAGIMSYVQRDSFRYSDHIEWPGRELKNPWATRPRMPYSQSILTTWGCTPRRATECARWPGAVCLPRIRKTRERRRSFPAWLQSGESRCMRKEESRALTVANFTSSTPATACHGQCCRCRQECRWSARTGMRQRKYARWNSGLGARYVSARHFEDIQRVIQDRFHRVLQ